jgi:Helix-turn-helix domain
MSGHRPFSDLTKHFSPERQARIAEKVCTLKQAMALADLREARAHSQADLAARLHVQQPAVAKMERRTDMYVSTLRQFIEAMGGTLEIVAHFPDGSVTITNFAAIGHTTDEETPDAPRSTASPPGTRTTP